MIFIFLLFQDNNFSLSNLINNIGTSDNHHTNQGFPSSDNFVSDVFTSSFGSNPAPTLQSLVDTFGGFDSEKKPSYNGWPEPSQTEVKTPIKFPSQMLSQSSAGARASPFSDSTESSSLFSSSGNLSRLDYSAPASQFT